MDFIQLKKKKRIKKVTAKYIPLRGKSETQKMMNDECIRKVYIITKAKQTMHVPLEKYAAALLDNLIKKKDGMEQNPQIITIITIITIRRIQNLFQQ